MPTSPAVHRLRAKWASASIRYARLVEPRPDGLPRFRVLLSLPAILLIIGTILVGLGINGTSSGAMYSRVSAGHDPQLIAGSPELIRSDEWYIGTTWSIAQAQQGLPETNQTMPGGMDAALPFDLPRADWSVIFRPHLWAYLTQNIDQGMAGKWWAPALALIAAAFCFLTTLLPRRPILAAALALGFYFSPFFQWWFQPPVFWPAAWALATMAGFVWALKSDSKWARWLWAAAVGYLTTVMAMGIYAPFIIPVVLVVAFYVIGLAVARLRQGTPPWELLGRAAPLLVAGVIGAAITGVWLLTKHTAVQAFLSTTYPGQRLTQTGSSNLLSLARMLSSSFSESLKNTHGFLGLNSSEASTFFFIGLFLFPVIGWAVYRSAKLGQRLPWEMIGLSVAVLVFAAFYFIPGWNGIAHLLFLDRTTEGRTRIGLGLASFALLGYLLRYLDQNSVKSPRTIALVSAVLFLVSQAAVAVALVAFGGIAMLNKDAPLWWLYAIGSAAAIYFFSRRRFALGAIAFLLVTALGTINVNPIYSGIFDLRTTPVGKEVMRIDANSPGTWVAVGGMEASGVVVESGVHAFNGTQGAPSKTMWDEIDPSHRYEASWNRLAEVTWKAGVGNPVVSNPAPDKILVTFDACAAFAQKYVRYVLSDNDRIATTCLVRDTSFLLPKSKTLTIYRVQPIAK